MTIVPGALYRHYKGMLYRARELVHHSETQEEMVLYEALYENKTGQMWVRPSKMWNETVVVNGKPVARFALVEEAQPSS